MGVPGLVGVEEALGLSLMAPTLPGAATLMMAAVFLSLVTGVPVKRRAVFTGDVDLW